MIRTRRDGGPAAGYEVDHLTGLTRLVHVHAQLAAAREDVDRLGLLLVHVARDVAVYLNAHEHEADVRVCAAPLQAFNLQAGQRGVVRPVHLIRVEKVCLLHG